VCSIDLIVVYNSVKHIVACKSVSDVVGFLYRTRPLFLFSLPIMIKYDLTVSTSYDEDAFKIFPLTNLLI